MKREAKKQPPARADLYRQGRYYIEQGSPETAVMAVAERRKAEAIATLDLRHFGTVKLQGAPRLIPRDL